MKCAAIDIGTNTILLLILDEHEGVFRDIIDMSAIVRLGEGLAKSGRLNGPAMSRTIDALRRYTDIARSHGVERLFCVGTAALREASNSEEFLRAVRDAFGFTIEIISARQEAYYTYLSVRDDPKVRGGSMTVIDIGGGSTEVIAGTDKEFVGFASLPMGSVRLTDAFITHDPPLAGELDQVGSYIRENLSTAPFPEASTLIGTGGTVTNIASIIIGIAAYDRERVHGFVIELSDLKEFILSLARLTTGERKNVKGMEPGREDIIVQGALILREIMEQGGFERCTVSAAGVRYGVIYEKCREIFN